MLKFKVKMTYSLSFYKFKLPLKVPYKLSFGPVSHFQTYIAVAQCGNNKGFGEITPLPGYNHETGESIELEIQALQASEKKHTSYITIQKELESRAPFFLSGLLCALETSLIGMESIFNQSINTLKIAAFCGGNTAEESSIIAEKLVSGGYSTLKMKVGSTSIQNELERVKAVADSIGDRALIRLDANQSYSWDDALFFCRELEHIRAIQLFEQPFPPHAWKLHEQLASQVLIPIMLDESIWTANDVKRAANSGIQFIKLKLCKHAGIKGSLDLIKLAKRLGLNIVYGNGVQTELGNQLEAAIYQKAKLNTAFEGNGFLKLANPFLKHTFQVIKGRIEGSGINNLDKDILAKRQNLLCQFPIYFPDEIS